MKTFNNTNYVKNLPDCYNKKVKFNADGTLNIKETGNNYKLLSLNNTIISELKKDISDLFNTLDIEQATGKTLDLYGEMYNQPRGLATDAQYRMLIKSKVLQNISSGDYKSIVAAICATFNCLPSEVLIREVKDKPCTIELSELPVNAINKAGLSISQVSEIVSRLLPAGVKFEQYLYEGTFEFADTQGVATTDHGFANDDGSIKGGFLGTIGYYETEKPLPTE
jgi:hypothetical protein